MQLVNQSYLFSSSEFDMYTMCHWCAFKVYNTIGLNPNSCSYCSKKKKETSSIHEKSGLKILKEWNKSDGTGIFNLNCYDTMQ